MYYPLLSSLVFPVAALAAPLDSRQSAGPSVTIQNGTLIGQTSQGVDSFKGIPFAQPPVGNLRLRPPQSISQSYGTLQLTNTTTSCPQFLIQQTDIPSDILGEILNSPLFQTIQNQGEDCLTIDVQRPAGTDASSNLPVLFWIYGGGFEIGSTGQTDGSVMIQKSIDMGAPIVYVQVSYRLAGFGFLGGKELAAEGATNLGLRDQRLGLEWVAENIAAFGGDPSRVTIWGESAGSFSVFDQLMINEGDNTYRGQPLFRAAIMQSGTVWPTVSITSNKAQNVYDSVVSNAGCSNATDTTACLRSLSYSDFHNAANQLPGVLSYRSNDLCYRPRQDPNDTFFSLSPDVSIATGKYAKVPVIIGDQEDEGTLFSLMMSNLTSNALFQSYLTSWYPDTPNATQLVAQLLSYYPDNILAGQPGGSPYDTADLNNFYPEFKRVASVLGDLTFTLSSRIYRSTVAASLPGVWSYYGSFLYGTPILGTYHAGDLPYAFGEDGNNSVTDTFQSYYVSFVNTLDPNTLGAGQGMIDWPAWTNDQPQSLNITKTSNFIVADTFRNDAYQFLTDTFSQWRI